MGPHRHGSDRSQVPTPNAERFHQGGWPPDGRIAVPLPMLDSVIGQLNFILLDPEPFTDAKRSAIRSDPRATKASRVRFHCSKCQSEIRSYTGLERLPDLEEDGYIWYENLPDSYACSCDH